MATTTITITATNARSDVVEMDQIVQNLRSSIARGLPIDLLSIPSEREDRDSSLPHAPKRPIQLTEREFKVIIKTQNTLI